LFRRIIMLLSIVIFCNLILSLPVQAEVEIGQEQIGIDTEMVDLAEEIDLAQVKDLLNQLDQDVQESLPDFSLSKIFEDLRNGELSLMPDDIGLSILKAILKEVVVNGPLIAKLLVLAVICAIINQLQLAFIGNVSRFAQMLVYLVLLGLVITSFSMAVEIGNNAIDKMVSFMQAILPVMFTILIATCYYGQFGFLSNSHEERSPAIILLKCCSPPL